jgi:hypothetical protein
MNRLLLIGLIALGTVGCGPKAGSKTPNDAIDADQRSGPDAKRSSAQQLAVNKPKTDEVSFLNQDRTDWYQVELKGKAGVLTTLINWDNENSDVNIDVFDAFGAQIAASPVRGKGEKQKKLFTQIDKPGTYFVRVTAPTRTDGSVYTVEAQWEEPPPVISQPPPEKPEEPVVEEKPRHKVREPREPKEPKEKPPGETVQARVVQSFREGPGLTLNIDKGSAAGIHVGDTGQVLQGAAGEDALDGGTFKVVKVLDANRCVGSSTLRSIGRNNRVTITLSK